MDGLKEVVVGAQEDGHVVRNMGPAKIYCVSGGFSTNDFAVIVFIVIHEHNGVHAPIVDPVLLNDLAGDFEDVWMVGDEFFDCPKEFGGLIAVRVWAWLDGLFLMFDFVFSFHNARSLAEWVGQLRSNPKLYFRRGWLRAAYQTHARRKARRPSKREIFPSTV